MSMIANITRKIHAAAVALHTSALVGEAKGYQAAADVAAKAADFIERRVDDLIATEVKIKTAARQAQVDATAAAQRIEAEITAIGGAQ
jgi:hypothetical protein